MEIPSQGNCSTDNPTQIKDGPENSDKFALLILSGIRKHKRSLGSPKQASTEAKYSPGRNNETFRVLMDVDDAGRGRLVALITRVMGAYRYDPM
jgi:hypothetical protein